MKSDFQTGGHCKGLGLRVWGLGVFRVKGLGVEGLGSRFFVFRVYGFRGSRFGLIWVLFGDVKCLGCGV